MRWVLLPSVIYFRNSFAIAFVCFCSLAGCGGVLYGSAATSAVVANDIKRYTLPSLEEIDRVEIQNKAGFFNRDMVRWRLSKPDEIADLVRLFNDNRSAWRNPQLVFVPNAPESYAGPYPRIISFWSKDKFVREVYLNKQTLTTQFDSKKIVREISQPESDAIYRLLENALNTL